MLKGPIKKLTTIAETCNSDLEAYSRYLGKKGSSSEDIAAILLLPEELINTSSSSLVGQFKAWAGGHLTSSNGVVTTLCFWEKIGTPLPSKLNKKDIELMLGMAQKAGYGIAPDPRYHHAKPLIDGKIVLFPEGHGEYFEPSKSFNSVGMALRLGAMVASIDQHIDESELVILKNLIDHNTKLSPTEKISLHAYLLWRLNTPANMAGLKARLENLQSKDKAAVSRLLISVALADGKIDPSEIKQLEKLYTALGLDKTLVTSDVHSYSSRKIPQGTQHTKSTVNSGNSPQDDTNTFKLNEEMLAVHETETQEVQSVLGSIFVSDDDIEVEPVASDKAQQKPDTGLDQGHYTLYESLKVKEHWKVDDAEKVSQELGLMLSGAIENINDWAFDKVDAPVLEEDDGIYVDMEIVEELEAV